MKKIGISFIFAALCISLASCATERKNLIVLSPDPDGKVGEISVTNKAGAQTIKGAWQATEIKNETTLPTTPFIITETEVKKLFGPALDAQPEPAVVYLLYFEHDSTNLTPESQVLLSEVLTTIKTRKSTDISVVGHTDSKGTRQRNFELSLNRARHVKDIVISYGVDPKFISVDGHGEDNPLIKTEDEISEPRNRRVEITVR